MNKKREREKEFESLIDNDARNYRGIFGVDIGVVGKSSGGDN